MRRDDLRLEVSDVDWLEGEGEPRLPTLTIHADLPADAFREAFVSPAGDGPSSADVDVTYRFQPGDGEGARDGVVAFSDRVTGEFLLEVNATQEVVMGFVAAARRYAEGTEDSAHYRAVLHATDEPVVDVEKRTLLVYSSDGELLRQRSLIPSGVEI